MLRIALTALACLLASPHARAADERELVVLVLIDALRPDHLGAYGYPKPTSPRIDALAERGRRYTRAYANAPWTRPSTACFLTGLNGSRHRTQSAEHKLPADVVTLAQRLGRAGWATAGFSANGNGGSLAGLHKGFDHFEDPTNTYKRSEMRKRCRERFGKTIDEKERAEAELVDCVRYNRLPNGLFLVDRALDHLRRTKAKKQFLFVFLIEPHDPYGAPPRLERQFLGDFKGEPRRRASWEINNDYSAAERRSMLAIYDAAIRFGDEAVGRLVDGLDEQGLLDHAHLFITADHGEGFGEHGFYLHAHHFWDEIINIPLVAVGPRFTPGVDDRLTQSLDVSATILALAGAKSDGLPGRSLLAPAEPDATVISEYNEFGIRRQAIIQDHLKVIWQRPADEAWYMRVAKKKEYFPSVSFDEEVVRAYDLKADPEEERPITRELPPEALALLEKLRAFVRAAPAR